MTEEYADKMIGYLESIATEQTKIVDALTSIKTNLQIILEQGEKNDYWSGKGGQE